MQSETANAGKFKPKCLTDDDYSTFSRDGLIAVLTGYYIYSGRVFSRYIGSSLSSSYYDGKG